MRSIPVAASRFITESRSLIADLWRDSAAFLYFRREIATIFRPMSCSDMRYLLSGTPFCIVLTVGEFDLSPLILFLDPLTASLFLGCPLGYTVAFGNPPPLLERAPIMEFHTLTLVTSGKYPTIKR